MNISLSLPLLLIVFFTGCAGSAPAENDPGQASPRTPEGYKGAAMTAKIGSGQLSVSIEVPTGGYRLELVETARESSHTDVKLRLTAPGVKEAVTQALETKVVKVALQSESGPIHVHLQERQRGAEYFVEPEFQLGKIVPR
jgi:hypothetical protein